MHYLLDTNILVHLVRNSEKSEEVQLIFNLFDAAQSLYISAVSKGELLSFAKQSAWGKSKMDKLFNILGVIPSVPVDGSSPLMDAYADIDAYSQGKHPDFQTPAGFSSRNMGKNDLWIAATALLLDLPLITTDNDFDHLHPNFIEVHKV